MSIPQGFNLLRVIYLIIIHMHNNLVADDVAVAVSAVVEHADAVDIATFLDVDVAGDVDVADVGF